MIYVKWLPCKANYFTAFLPILCLLISCPGLDEDVVYGRELAGVRVFYDMVLAGSQGSRRPVAVFSHWDDPRDNSNAIFVFLDGESSGPEEKFDHLLSKMLFIGPLITTGAKKSIYIPYASISFTERHQSPLDLIKNNYDDTKRSFFAAYIASNCVESREKAFDQLVTFAKSNQLGEVHALGNCHGSHPETKYLVPNSGRGEANFLDSSVEILKKYKYSLSFENTNVDGYVTEKIVSPFLAGAVPIYSGNEKVLEIFNKDSFFYVAPSGDISSILTTANFNEVKRKEMVSADKLTNEGFSCFPGIPTSRQFFGKGIKKALEMKFVLFYRHSDLIRQSSQNSCSFPSQKLSCVWFF